jgi:hypothetical protein
MEFRYILQGKRRDTWCPGNLARETLQEVLCLLLLKCLSLSPVSHETQNSLLDHIRGQNSRVNLCMLKLILKSDGYLLQWLIIE